MVYIVNLSSEALNHNNIMTFRHNFVCRSMASSTTFESLRDNTLYLFNILCLYVIMLVKTQHYYILRTSLKISKNLEKHQTFRKFWKNLENLDFQKFLISKIIFKNFRFQNCNLEKSSKISKI